MPTSRRGPFRHREDDRRLELNHPASSGVVLDNCAPLSAGAQEAGTAYVSLLVDDAEFITASAAPALVHGELVSGRRAVLKVHDLDLSARRGLMALLVEHGYLTSDEGEWLTRDAGSSMPTQGEGVPAV